MSTSEQRGNRSVPAPRRAVRRAVGRFIVALLTALAGIGVVILAATQPVLVVRGKPRTYADAETLKAHVTMLSRTFPPTRCRAP
jgi:hypothetical protein